MPDSVWIALISALSGGTLLELIKRMFARGDREMDEATAMWLELRQDLDRATHRIDELADQLEECRGHHWEDQRRIVQLESHVHELERHHEWDQTTERRRPSEEL